MNADPRAQIVVAVPDTVRVVWLGKAAAGICIARASGERYARRSPERSTPHKQCQTGLGEFADY